MENQSVYKITAKLYANRYTGLIETILLHVDGLITFEQSGRAHEQQPNDNGWRQTWTIT